MMILILVLMISSFSLVLIKYEKIKEKKLVAIAITGLINVFILPMSMFIGVMATDAPTSTILDFIMGFLFIQIIPLITLIIFIIKRFKIKK